MANKILSDAVEKRRAEFSQDNSFLSDWQVHAANLVYCAILSKAEGSQYDAGPRYLPFPTGSGKTVGARWGIVKVARDYPEKRICFLTPYQTAVDSASYSSVHHPQSL